MTDTVSRRPEASETTADYHHRLLAQLPGDCVLQVMQQQRHWLCELSGNLSTEQIDKIHPPYGWTIRQVFEHCGDAERVFGYRILRAAAGDETELPGWDENQYADARFGLGNFVHLVAELDALRTSNLMLLRRIVPAAWDRSIQADGQRLTVRAIAWVAAAHLQHHFRIVQQRCGFACEPTD